MLAHTYTPMHTWLKKSIITLFVLQLYKVGSTLENHLVSRGKLEFEKGYLKYNRKLEPLWARYCMVIIRRNIDT